MILAVTGHRPPKLGGYQVPNRIFDMVTRRLDEMLIRMNPSEVLVGMALGVDQWAADLCAINDIPFTAVIPFEGYESKWPRESQVIYENLLGRAKAVRVLAGRPPEGANVEGLIRLRNRWLIRECEALLAVYNGEGHTGTGQTINYAVQMNRPIHLVALPPHIWAEARTVWERLEARRMIREGQTRVESVGSLENRLRRQAPNGFSREVQAEREDFAARFPAVAEAASKEKKAERLKEDVANLKPRRVLDVGDD